MEDEAIEYLSDLRFAPHLIIIHKSSLGAEEKSQLQESTNHAKLGAIVANGMTLREKKGVSGDLEPVESWYFRSIQTVSENLIRLTQHVRGETALLSQMNFSQATGTSS